jgi:hypothetical protein
MEGVRERRLIRRREDCRRGETKEEEQSHVIGPFGPLELPTETQCQGEK